jgi:peptidoglycan/LPS O-acetylase OafA/YrhL
MDRDRPNGITALRFFLAATVVVFHAWPLGGFGPDPVQVLTGGQARNGGSIAIMAFFGLSGYLLLQSRQRSSPVAFAWRRALRIFPGYWISIIATAFIVGPWYLAFAWFPGPGVGASVNASLWTLFPEIICYAVLALVPTRALVVVVPGLVAGLALVSMRILPMGFAGELVGMFLAFGTGSMLALMNLRPSSRRAIALFLVLVAATALDRWMVAMPAVVAYLAIWAGLRLPLYWTRDLSYGTYIYAFPIGLAVAAAGGAKAGIVPFILVTLALTIPIALASWMLVELPALAFKNGVPLPRGLSRAHLRSWASEAVETVTAQRSAGAAAPVRLTRSPRPAQQADALEAA